MIRVRVPWVVGVSGASGTPYAAAVLRGLFDAGCAVDMLVVPASTAACAGIALGLSKDLLQRAAEVNLKERRPVVVVPRETPVTRSHLEHLLALHDAGAVVLPASPGFYGAGAQATAGQLVDFVAGKVLDAVAVSHSLFTRWSGELGHSH